MDIHPVEYFLFHSTGQDKHKFHKTGIDTMIVIRKYPAYPVNPVKNEKKHHCFIKLYEFVDFDIMPLEVDYDCY